jgi:hypothetical protein
LPCLFGWADAFILSSFYGNGGTKFLNDFNDFQESGVTQPSLISTKILGMSTASSFYVGMLNDVGISYALPSAR